MPPHLLHISSTALAVTFIAIPIAAATHAFSWRFPDSGVDGRRRPGVVGLMAPPPPGRKTPNRNALFCGCPFVPARACGTPARACTSCGARSRAPPRRTAVTVLGGACAEDHSSASPPACAHGDGSSWLSTVHMAALTACARYQPSPITRWLSPTRAAPRFCAAFQVGLCGRAGLAGFSIRRRRTAGVRTHDTESSRTLLWALLHTSARVGSLRVLAPAVAHMREPRRGGRASTSSAMRVLRTSTRVRRRRRAHTAMAPRAGKCT